MANAAQATSTDITQLKTNQQIQFVHEDLPGALKGKTFTVVSPLQAQKAHWVSTIRRDDGVEYVLKHALGKLDSIISENSKKPSYPDVDLPEDYRIELLSESSALSLIGGKMSSLFESCVLC